MIDDLATQKLLGPFRGEAAVDRGQLADVLVGLGRLAHERSDVASVDINPLIVQPTGEVVAQAVTEGDELIVLPVRQHDPRAEPVAEQDARTSGRAVGLDREDDQPGVLAQIARILGEANISIASVLQREVSDAILDERLQLRADLDAILDKPLLAGIVVSQDPRARRLRDDRPYGREARRFVRGPIVRRISATLRCAWPRPDDTPAVPAPRAASPTCPPLAVLDRKSVV